jgi:hypothetical protein
MKSADDKAARFGHEAHEAAIAAVFVRLYEYFDGSDESVTIEEELRRLMRLPERPATAPGDWVAVMAEAESLLWANSDWGRDWWWRDVKALGEKCRDMAKAEPVPESRPQFVPVAGGGVACRVRRPGEVFAEEASEPAPEASGDAKLRALREKVCGWAGGSTDPRSADPSDIDVAQLVREIDRLLAEPDGGAN